MNNQIIIRNTKLALGIATAMLGSYAGRVHAGACGAASPSVCTVAANATTDVTQSPSHTGGTLSVTTNAGFGIDTATTGGPAISLISTGANTISFIDNNNSSISSPDSDALYVRNSGNGSTTIETSGLITGGSDGIQARNSSLAGLLSITTSGNVTGTDNGIRAHSNSTTGAVSITTTAGTTITGTNRTAIDAYSYYQPITIVSSSDLTAGLRGIRTFLYDPNGAAPTNITSNGTISAVDDGIHAYHYDGAASDITITNNGVISSTNRHGVFASISDYSAGGDISITNNDTITSHEIGIFAFTPNGNININNTGDIDANNNDGIRARSELGEVQVTSNSPINSTSGKGIDVRSYSDGGNGKIDVSMNAPVTAGNAGIFAVASGITGDVTITTTNTITADQQGIFVLSDHHTGNVQINVGGNITSNDDGIRFESLTGGASGSLTITGTGNITGGTSVGNDGIDVSAQESSVLVDVNGIITGDPGITITSLAGPITVAGTGAVIANGGHGIHARITGKGATENITINRDGAITATGADNGIFVENSGTGDNNITVSQPINPDTGVGIDTQTNGGTTNITLNSGADAEGGISNDEGNSITTINSGAKISGSINLAQGVDSLTFNGGDFSGVTLFDGGVDIFSDDLTFENTGVKSLLGVNVVNWKEVNIKSGSNLMFTDNALTTGGLHNAGTLSTQDGTADDSMTITGDYEGLGGTLALDVQLGDDASPADKLVIVNDSSGNSVLNINNIGGAGAATTGNGILVVQVNGSSGGVFSLASPVRAGNYLYDLAKVGNNWYLQSTFSLAPPPAPETIPTLSEWGQILLVSLLGLFGLFSSKRRRKTNRA